MRYRVSVSSFNIQFTGIPEKWETEKSRDKIIKEMLEDNFSKFKSYMSF